MSLFVWKRDYAVGCAEVDEQHERLFHMADELHRAMLERRGKEALASLLKRLLAYTEYHFASEERLMQETGYTGYLPHRREHVKLTEQVLEYQNRMSGGESQIAIDLMKFLSDWLKHHIQGSDVKFAAHLKSRLRPRVGV
jgi:hemerythrin-like metal-binding protein